MMAFTAVLLYPQHMTRDYGADIYINSAEAHTWQDAVREVQKMASDLNGGPDEVDPDDFRMIAVFEGDLKCAADATCEMMPEVVRDRKTAPHSVNN